MRQTAGKLLLIGTAAACSLLGRKFYSDDPLLREPAPLPVKQAAPRRISDVYDFLWHTFATPGDKNTAAREIRAQDVNTLGEVVEGSWYEKRHGRRRMTAAELAAGPGASAPPAPGSWTVVSAKTEGITPGFLIQDGTKRRYFLKFDPPGYPELATAADVIGTKFFYALGYHTPENYIVYFDRSRLRLQPGVRFVDEHGRRRELTARDLQRILNQAPRTAEGSFRACASLLLPGANLGPFRFFGTRADDPNDVVPHEHRRSLRGLHVFAAWLGHDDSRSVNTLDMLVAGPDGPYIRHHLIDFGSLFGSASNGPTSPRSGFEPLFSWKNAAMEFFTFGAYVPEWARARYPSLPSVGRFGTDYFDPVNWTPEYPNPAFLNRLPEDTLWAAEQVMSFSDEDIRVLVGTGGYTDPAAAAHMTRTLIARRDAIGRAYLSGPFALSQFGIRGDDVVFEELAHRYRYVMEPTAYRYRWSVLDNESDGRTEIRGAATLAIPRSEAAYLALDILAGNESGRVTVYLTRSAKSGYRIIGIERILE
jgi:hypothetical protein